MNQSPKHCYEFGPFRLDARERLLTRGGESVSLTPKAFDLLLALLERHGRLVEKEELFQAVWPDTIVEESNLSSNIALIRKALNDGANGVRYIETVPKRGYRFVAEVRERLSVSAEDVAVQKARLVADAVPAVSTSALPRWAIRQKRTILLITVMLLLAVIGSIALRRPSVLPPVKLIPFTTLPGRESDMTFSPDGNQLVFTWDGGGQDSPLHLYVKQVGNEAVRQVTNGPGHEISPSWSPDGREIAFIRWTDNGRSLYVIPSLGGAEQKINEDVFYFSARIAWTPDSKGLVIQGNDAANEPRSIYFVSRETGEMQKLTTPPDGIYGDRFPALSPDGKFIAFCRAASISQSDLYLLPLSGGEPKRLTFDQADSKWPV